ncbi:MAG: prepilin-type N-terminal cleavage/methylation domain-containing protein [Patescibacteria group bacterium]
MKKNQNMKAFTLLEVLIATAIFASVMVIVSIVVMQSSNISMKLKAERDVNEESSRIGDILSRDIKSARNAVNITIDNICDITTGVCDASPKTFEYKSGLALFSMTADEKIYKSYSSAPESYDHFIAPTNFSAFEKSLLVISGNQLQGETLNSIFIVYLAKKDIMDVSGQTEYSNGKLYRTVIPADSSYSINISQFSNFEKDENLVSGNDESSIISFYGYAPGEGSCLEQSWCKQQPYIGFLLQIDTIEQSQYRKATAILRSLITVRNYNI